MADNTLTWLGHASFRLDTSGGKHVAVLPIGDHFTMGPREASVAIELLGVKRVVPCHWGTFGLLTGTPDQLDVPAGVTLERIDPGESIVV